MVDLAGSTTEAGRLAVFNYFFAAGPMHEAVQGPNGKKVIAALGFPYSSMDFGLFVGPGSWNRRMRNKIISTWEEAGGAHNMTRGRQAVRALVLGDVSCILEQADSFGQAFAMKMATSDQRVTLGEISHFLCSCVWGVGPYVAKCIVLDLHSSSYMQFWSPTDLSLWCGYVESGGGCARLGQLLQYDMTSPKFLCFGSARGVKRSLGTWTPFHWPVSRLVFATSFADCL